MKALGTEAPSYKLDTQSIINWLKERQREGTFVVTGAGIDWLEARFIDTPQDMAVFAKQVAAFAPDVLGKDVRTVANLAERLRQNNAFFLVWD